MWHLFSKIIRPHYERNIYRLMFEDPGPSPLLSMLPERTQ
jgi:hypothetical protein